MPPSITTTSMKAKWKVPTAWNGGEKVKISAGLVSEVDLFNQISTKSFQKVINDGLLCNEKSLIKYGILNNYWLSESLSVTNDDKIGADTPLFLSADSDIDYYNVELKELCNHNDMSIYSKEGFNSGNQNAMRIIQNPGELVLIPPRWWHQVYHLEPSIAVASQYCNSVNKYGVFQHILGQSKANIDSHPMIINKQKQPTSAHSYDRLLYSSYFQKLSDEEQVKEILIISLNSQFNKFTRNKSHRLFFL